MLRLMAFPSLRTVASGSEVGPENLGPSLVVAEGRGACGRLLFMAVKGEALQG